MSPKSKKQMNCSADIAEQYKKLKNRLQEEIWVSILNARNQVVGSCLVGKGTDRECLVSPCDIFRMAIVKGSTRIVVIHNHPSGDPTPSPNDVSLTRRLVDSGELIGITVLDHIVIASDGYTSLRDLGLMVAKSEAC